MNDFTDRLESWWEHAEQGIAHAGDTVIRREDTDGSYQVYTLEVGPIGKWADVRILHRAPAPKPAWHDAVAVIAHRQGDYGFTAREVYVSGVDDKWESAHYYARTSELIDPVPLIEQKVTDEMVLNYLNHSWGAEERGTDAFEEVEVRAARNALTAALGLDPATAKDFQ